MYVCLHFVCTLYRHAHCILTIVRMAAAQSKWCSVFFMWFVELRLLLHSFVKRSAEASSHTLFRHQIGDTWVEDAHDIAVLMCMPLSCVSCLLAGVFAFWHTFMSL